MAGVPPRGLTLPCLAGSLFLQASARPHRGLEEPVREDIAAPSGANFFPTLPTFFSFRAQSRKRRPAARRMDGTPLLRFYAP